jgi:hypothetical protein
MAHVPLRLRHYLHMSTRTRDAFPNDRFDRFGDSWVACSPPFFPNSTHTHARTHLHTCVHPRMHRLADRPANSRFSLEPAVLQVFRADLLQ